MKTRTRVEQILVEVRKLGLFKDLSDHEISVEIRKNLLIGITKNEMIREWKESGF